MGNIFEGRFTMTPEDIEKAKNKGTLKEKQERMISANERLKEARESKEYAGELHETPNMQGSEEEKPEKKAA